ncbi:MAG: hypothetical protein JO256_00980 [Alphaproteobacteria bacterium]|nr:hypothetical protein [Alphaproteobacteria bacterium]
MTRLAFAPLIPQDWLILLGLAMLVLLVWSFLARAKGAWARTLVFAALLAVLAGPITVHETREPLNDVAVIVTDRSQSMEVGTRTKQAQAAYDAVRRALAAMPNLIVRETSVTTTPGGDNNGTQAFAALNAAIADVPPGRMAGAILISDGQVHDAPPDAAHAALKAPLQVLLAGSHGEKDRKLTITAAARFAIVGKNADIELRVDDLGGGEGGTSEMTLSVDGKAIGNRSVAVGKPGKISVPITHEGENVVEIAAAPGDHELTLANNRAVVTVTGVRDRLRVVLVSGEPHAGERVWRNLLKADPSVDLIHFTILRPPYKQDQTPIDELSLIAFPYRQLFLEKLDSFDLVILDRYAEQGILPPLYFQNIARYVEAGGALLVASGPELAGPTSVSRTPLAQVMPVQPSGEVVTGPFKPVLTAEGQAHPVTAGLPQAGDGTAPPAWGRWFRAIGANKLSGTTVMNGPNNRPLLVLDQVGKGRVAALLSDQAWLWARGFEGGGPDAELLRRLAHWLMKQPELEAESLSASVVNGEVQIARRTMAPAARPVSVTTPSGKTLTADLSKSAPGMWTGRVPATELGLYRLNDGQLAAVAAAGPLNPREVSDMRATDEVLKPLADATGGSVHWLADGMPQVRQVNSDSAAYGSNWLGMVRNNAYRVTSLTQKPLLPQWATLLILAGVLLLAWRVEGR